MKLSATPVELTGILGRPKYIRVQRALLFIAGLGIRHIDGQLEWFSVAAWGESAIKLFQLPMGQTATLPGAWKTKHWAKDGEARSVECSS